MDRTFDSLWKLITRWPRTILFLSFIIFVTSIISARHLQYSITIQDNSGDQIPAAVLGTKLSKDFELGYDGSVIIRSPVALTDQQVCGIYKTLREAVKKQGLIVSVDSPFDIRYPQVTKDQGIKKIWYPPILNTGCDPQYPVNFEQLEKHPLANYYTQDRKDLLTTFYFDELEEPGRYNTVEPLLWAELIQDIKIKVKKYGNLEVTEAGSLSYISNAYIGFQRFKLLNVILLVLVVIVFRLYFGTWFSGLLAVFNFFVAGVILYGGATYFGYKFDSLSNSLFLMITVAGLEDFIFLFSTMLEARKKWENAFREFMKVSFFTSLTTAIGFASLGVSDLPMIKDFGVLAGVGAMIEWFVSFILTPAILTTVPKFGKMIVNREKAVFLEWIDRAVSFSFPKKLAYFFILLQIISTFLVPMLTYSSSLTSIFPADHPYMQDVDYLQKTRGWLSTASVVFKPGTADESVENIKHQVSHLPKVSQAVSWHEVADHTLNDVPAEDYEVVMSDLRQSKWFSFFQAQSGVRRFILFLNTDKSNEVIDLQAQVNKICNSNCYLAGDIVTYGELSTLIPNTVFDSFVFAGLLIMMILFLLAWQFSLRDKLALIITALWGPCLLVGVVYLLGLQINLLTCVFLSALVGLAGDNAITYIMTSQEAKLATGIANRQGGSIRVLFSMVVCSLVLYGSVFDPPKVLSLIMCLGYCLTFFGDLFLLKSLIKEA